MSKWQLIFDAERCNSCNNCVLATKDEYLFNRFEGYSEPAPRQGDLWFKVRRHERGAAPMIDVTHYIETCHQCADAPCITDATRDVISQREDGIVIIDPVKAKGRKDLVAACPFGQIHWNEEHQVPQKYSLDAHLLDNGWAEPRGVQVCPTMALTIAKLDDAAMARRAADEGLINLPAAAHARPRVWFKNIGPLSHAFLGGTLVRSVDGREDCVPGMRVRLTSSTGEIVERRSDVFGDFKVDGLAGAGESYRLEVSDHEERTIFERSVVLTESLWIGTIEV